MYSIPPYGYTPRDTASNGQKSLRKLALCAVVLAILTVAGVWWINTHPMPNSGPPSITLETAVVDPNANTFKAYVGVSGSMSYHMAIYPAQDLSNGTYLLERSLPYAVYRTNGLKITGSYLDAQRETELVFLLLSRSDVEKILANPGAGAVDGFQVVNESDFDGSAQVLRLQHRVTLR